jgi:serine/threonine protein kinase
LSLEQIVPLGVQTAAALHYLAGERVVHLDVKPSNVLMSAPPRLIDFGGARTTDAVAQLRRPVGTALYTAPEVCGVPETTDRVGAAADVWSLGATLYYGLAGVSPFERGDGAKDSDDPFVRFPQLVEAPPPLGRGVPPALEQVVHAMLEPDPSARPAAAEVADMLSELLD